MIVFETLVLLTIICIITYSLAIYNRLIQVKVNVDKSWANIEVLEKQRYDEIPNLIRVCESYMKYERETLERITQARTKFLEATTPGQVAEADSEFTNALKSLFAVAENYPELKSNNNFMQLQQRISYLESQIADRREFYNDSVMIFNTRIKQIPDVFIAKLMSYSDKEMYQVSKENKQIPEVKFRIPA
jgi:LemA protein